MVTTRVQHSCRFPLATAGEQIEDEEALLEAATVEAATRSKYASQLRSLDHIMRICGVDSVHEGVRKFIADYVPNRARTGAGMPRKASGLEKALGSLIAGLKAREGWEPSARERQEYRMLERGVYKRHAGTTQRRKAKPMLLQHLIRIKEHLPELEGTAKQRSRIAKLLNGYALLVLMFQGIMRKSDVGHILLENVHAKCMRVDGKTVRYYVIKLQDKPRLGTLEWRHVTIVERRDDLDAYALLRMLKQRRACGHLFGSQKETTKLVDRTVNWARRHVPRMEWLTGHSLRVGGLLALEKVAGDDASIRFLQGGWSSHGAGKDLQARMASSSSGYLRVNTRFLQALLTVGKEPK